MSPWHRFLIYSVAFCVLPVAIGAAGLHELRARERPAPQRSDETVDAPRPALDPARRTVVVVLGADITEITDALGPYEMFARAGGFNVVTAAPSRAPTLLTGGLQLVPHFSFTELDERLAGRPADIVVVPNIPNIAATHNAPVVAWLQRQSAGGAMMHSWCTGAMALAEAGLLDGRTATAHWGDLPRLEKAYPRVDWIRGVRWIDHGQLVMSAGITSGIDASLHVIARLTGDANARRVARELRYPNYHFAIDPRVAPYSIRPADGIHFANAAFRVGRARIGVALYPGLGELDLSNIYDAHAYTTVADVRSVATTPGVIVTAHGLTLLPSRSVSPELTRSLDRLVIPGPDARTAAAPFIAALAAATPSLRPEFLHADEPERFGLEPVLEDLARTANVPTARFALRRLEYRSDTVHLSGSAVPWRVILTPLVLGIAGVAVAWLWLRAARNRRVARRRQACARIFSAHAGTGSL
jgi:putative intracellular protease/amidase